MLSAETDQAVDARRGILLGKNFVHGCFNLTYFLIKDLKNFGQHLIKITEITKKRSYIIKHNLDPTEKLPSSTTLTDTYPVLSKLRKARSFNL